MVFPNQAPGDRGAHVNISGAGLVKTAPNADAAKRFLEFLVTDKAQEMFALGNMEYPAVADAPLHPALRALGSFRGEPVDAARTNAACGGGAADHAARRLALSVAQRGERNR